MVRRFRFSSLRVQLGIAIVAVAALTLGITFVAVYRASRADLRHRIDGELQAQVFEMETAALAHVAYANRIPYIAFRSLSDLAGADEFNADAVALFASGLAETNEAAVTLAFLDGWHHRGR